MTPNKNTITCELSGHYRLRMSSPERGDHVVAEFDNLILDAGLDRVAAGTLMSHCHVGSGAATPATTDTSLQTFLASSSTTGTGNNTTTYVAGPPDYIELLVVRTFGAGVGTGNISEIGMGWSATTGSLFSRALVVDGGGSPLTIVKAADETLTVEYRLRIYPPASDVTGSKTISGSSYSYVIRPALVSTVALGPGSFGWNTSYLLGFSSGIRLGNVATAYGSGATLGTRTSTPSAASQTNAYGSLSSATYSTGSYSRQCTLTSGLSNANTTGGVGALLFGFQSDGDSASIGAAFQISFSPVLPKDATKVLNLTFTITWARR